MAPGTTKQMDSNRAEILRLLITCFSEPLYLLPEGEGMKDERWRDRGRGSWNKGGKEVV